MGFRVPGLGLIELCRAKASSLPYCIVKFEYAA